MREIGAMNIVVSDITTVKVTECKGAKVLYHKYQKRLHQFLGFLVLDRKKCQTSISCVCRYFVKSIYDSQRV
jgi:hypothetical protein